MGGFKGSGTVTQRWSPLLLAIWPIVVGSLAVERFGAWGSGGKMRLMDALSAELARSIFLIERIWQ